MRSLTTQGLTLIEAIIYVALFGLIVSAGLGATYNLLTSTEELDRVAMTQVEAHFILHKLQFEIEHSVTADVILSNELQLVDIDNATTTFMFNSASETVSIIRDDNSPIVLHSEVVPVNLLSFQDLGGTPHGIEVSLTINDTAFDRVRYYALQ